MVCGAPGRYRGRVVQPGHPVTGSWTFDRSNPHPPGPGGLCFGPGGSVEPGRAGGEPTVPSSETNGSARPSDLPDGPVLPSGPRVQEVETWTWTGGLSQANRVQVFIECSGQWCRLASRSGACRCRAGPAPISYGMAGWHGPRKSTERMMTAIHFPNNPNGFSMAGVGPDTETQGKRAQFPNPMSIVFEGPDS